MRRVLAILCLLSALSACEGNHRSVRDTACEVVRRGCAAANALCDAATSGGEQ